MSKYAVPAKSAIRPFITTPYVAGVDGVLEPQLPDVCIFHKAGETCSITVDHVRARKTGPCFPLTVVFCAVHEVGFTLYPPGHFPYGRRALAPVAPGGEPLRSVTDSPDAQTDEPWRGTVFDAALDAASGQRWARKAQWGADTWWSSQERQLAVVVRLLGVDPDQDLDTRHRLGETLAVDTLVLVEGAKLVSADPGYRSRGGAVVGVLKSLPASTSLRRVLAAGHLACLWGPPLWWDPTTRQLRSLAFFSSGTDPP